MSPCLIVVEKKIVDLCFNFIWLLSSFLLHRAFFDERQMSTYNFSSKPRGEKTLQAIFTVSGGGKLNYIPLTTNFFKDLRDLEIFFAPYSTCFFRLEKGKEHFSKIGLSTK